MEKVVNIKKNNKNYEIFMIKELGVSNNTGLVISVGERVNIGKMSGIVKKIEFANFTDDEIIFINFDNGVIATVESAGFMVLQKLGSE